MTPGFVQGFVEWLARSSGFPVRVAAHGEHIEPGQAYVAPDHFHMGVGSGNRIFLSQSAPENGTRPSVSFLFRSAKEAFGTGVAAVLLTGMGKDGVEELQQLNGAGAVTIAQDKESSVVYGMPGEAVQAGAATYILPPDGIAKMISTLMTKP
jgi:two-component system chemotaxis response regulator CheB